MPTNPLQPATTAQDGPWNDYAPQAVSATAAPTPPTVAVSVASPDGPWKDYAPAGPASAPPATPAAAADGPWNDYAPATAAAAPAAGGFLATAKDAAESAGSGVVRGVEGLVALPATIQRGLDWATNKLWGPAPALPPGLNPGAGTVTPDAVKAAVYEGQDAVSAWMNRNLHTPTTPAGDLAQTVGEIAPSAFGGPESLVSKIIGNVAVPAVASTAAGELTKGTALEPWARAAGGLAGGLGAGLARAAVTAPTRAVVAASRSLAPMDLAAALHLQQTAQRVGVPLTGPEAIQAASGGATKLGDLQRVVEGAGAGSAPLSGFYAQRPGQVQQAAGRMFDAIAPAPAEPSTIGPQAAAAAQAAIDRVRQNINATTAPNYQLANMQGLSPTDFAPIGGNPAFQDAVSRLRADPVLGPQYQGMPDSSIPVIDAATKDMTARGQALASITNPGFNPQKAAMYTGGATDARTIARGAVPEYDAALTQQAAMRSSSLNPLEQGPLGQVAGATTTPQAYGALVPSQPLAGGDQEIGLASHMLAAQRPDIVGALVRQGMADQFDQSAANLASGPNPFGGARFAADVAGTPQQRTNLAAALGATVNPDTAQRAVDDTLNVLQATGTRRPAGSATAFNSEYMRQLGQPSTAASVAAAPFSFGTTMAAKARDVITRMALDRNTGQLANMFIAPDSVQQIATLAARPAQTPIMDAVRRGMVQAATVAR